MRTGRRLFFNSEHPVGESLPDSHWARTDILIWQMSLIGQMSQLCETRVAERLAYVAMKNPAWPQAKRGAN